jgi:hypothetical protein
MGRLNADPIVTFPDGARLLVSTNYCGEGQFTCELFLADADHADRMDLRAVSSLPEAATCRQAQASAYTQARHLYPGMADSMKEPPYLIWSGPSLPSCEPEARSRSGQRRRE